MRGDRSLRVFHDFDQIAISVFFIYFSILHMQWSKACGGGKETVVRLLHFASSNDKK